MSTRASAARYARALLDVAVKESDPERIDGDLTALAGLFRGQPELQRALTHPAVPVAAKRRAVEAIAASAKLPSPLAKLLALLADRDRLALVPDLAAVYRERLMEHLQIVDAEVTTAAPLPADRLATLEQRLAAATGRKVTMTTRVDPSLIGGAVARIGSIVYDSSVATQLSKVRQRLQEQV